MTITTYVSMDLALAGAKGRVNAMQNDKYTRRVVLSLYEHGVPWEVPAGCTATVRYRKADGTGGIYDALPDGSMACSIAENKVTLILAPQVCAAAGPVQLVVSLQLNETELLTFPLQVQVHADPGEGVKSVNYTALWGAENGCYNLFADGDYIPTIVLSEPYTGINVTEHVDPKKIVAATEYGLGLRVHFLDGSGNPCSAVLQERYETDISSKDDGEGGTLYTYSRYYCGLVSDPYTTGFGEIVLKDTCVDNVHTVTLHRYLQEYTDGTVKTVNGVSPDEDGNVEVATSRTATAMDLSNWDNGTFTVDFDDGTRMNGTVTFDEAGNPVSIGDGTNTMTITWPTEVTE